GGMGAYSPAPVVTPAIHDRIMQQVMIPTVRGLSSEGLEYRGFLYAGLMIDSEGNPNVLEFNCRFGDPETQPILFRLRSDLTELCLKSFDGTLDTAAVEWDSRAALGVVMASNGYPDNYKKGLKIQGLEPISDDRTKIFQAGTTMKNGQVLTNGGRVLCAVALGNTVSEARIRAYEAVEKIDWEGAIYRRDIGYRAIERERTNAS
ncbi:MAG: phosphoribosylglycinamide synthetase C domain-containing protein, partial [Gammaproteobacteria bacterium]